MDFLFFREIMLESWGCGIYKSLYGTCRPPTSMVSTGSLSYTGQFRAGNIAKHINAWRSLTSDERILSIVMGCQLEFGEPHCQTKAPGVTNLSAKEVQIASAEVQKLLDKRVITKTTHDVD